MPISSHHLETDLHSIVPGGSHTYAKGDDQFPVNAPKFIERGNGCHVWDPEGNHYIEYGMGLRAVTLGHAHPAVVESVTRQLQLGVNFSRPSPIEAEAAECILSCIPGAEMVKFAKNGSDVTTAAVKLARAYTGRDMIAICQDQPFFSTDDWFIGSTEMRAGIPEAIVSLTVKFRYNDLSSLAELFTRYPRQIACVILEAESTVVPDIGYLEGVKQLCERDGCVLIFDEMITGFRWHLGGAQTFHGVIPHLSTFGKAISNGFALAALAGKREIMNLGGIQHDKERVFLLSTTHGAETHSLAAAIETVNVYRKENVIQQLWERGAYLRGLVEKSIQENNLEGHFSLIGRPCNLIFTCADLSGKPSQLFRTLFMQELIRRGIIAPSFVISIAHSDEVIEQTAQAVHEAHIIYRKALDQGVDRFLEGRPVKPVFRAYN